MKELSPKNQFLLATEDAKRHRDLVVQPWFHSAIALSLAEMTVNIPQAESVTAGVQLAGARTFIRTLLNIAETHQAPKPLESRNLISEEPKPKQPKVKP